MKNEIIKIAKDLEQGIVTTEQARTLLLGLLGVGERNLSCVINPENGRMRIDSLNELGSMALDRWIEENRYCFDKRLDIDIYAH